MDGQRAEDRRQVPTGLLERHPDLQADSPAAPGGVGGQCHLLCPHPPSLAHFPLGSFSCGLRSLSISALPPRLLHALQTRLLRPLISCCVLFLLQGDCCDRLVRGCPSFHAVLSAELPTFGPVLTRGKHAPLRRPSHSWWRRPRMKAPASIPRARGLASPPCLQGPQVPPTGSHPPLAAMPVFAFPLDFTSCLTRPRRLPPGTGRFTPTRPPLVPLEPQARPRVTPTLARPLNGTPGLPFPRPPPPHGHLISEELRRERRRGETPPPAPRVGGRASLAKALPSGALTRPAGAAPVLVPHPWRW